MVVSTEMYHIIPFVPVKYENSIMCMSVILLFVTCTHDIWIIIGTFF